MSYLKKRIDRDTYAIMDENREVCRVTRSIVHPRAIPVHDGGKVVGAFMTDRISRQWWVGTWPDGSPIMQRDIYFPGRTKRARAETIVDWTREWWHENFIPPAEQVTQEES